MRDTQFEPEAKKQDRLSAVSLQRTRGKSSFPFGPVGVRQERRKAFRANELSMSNASMVPHPRRRETDGPVS